MADNNTNTLEMVTVEAEEAATLALGEADALAAATLFPAEGEGVTTEVRAIWVEEATAEALVAIVVLVNVVFTGAVALDSL